MLLIIQPFITLRVRHKSHFHEPVWLGAQKLDFEVDPKRIAANLNGLVHVLSIARIEDGYPGPHSRAPVVRQRDPRVTGTRRIWLSTADPALAGEPF